MGTNICGTNGWQYIQIIHSNQNIDFKGKMYLVFLCSEMIYQNVYEQRFWWNIITLNALCCWFYRKSLESIFQRYWPAGFTATDDFCRFHSGEFRFHLIIPRNGWWMSSFENSCLGAIVSISDDITLPSKTTRGEYSASPLFAVTTFMSKLPRFLKKNKWKAITVIPVFLKQEKQS